jgi:hypothetical protein
MQTPSSQIPSNRKFGCFFAAVFALFWAYEFSAPVSIVLPGAIGISVTVSDLVYYRIFILFRAKVKTFLAAPNI